MNNEQDLRAQFEDRVGLLDAWGKHVVEVISCALQTELRRRGWSELNVFLKLPPKHRVKDTASFLAKALHRNKRYRDPLDQITDQVGVRFVVLLSHETELFAPIIASQREWETSQDRNYESERVLQPHSFDYESHHFVVRPRLPLEIGALIVPAGTPCEVQVRTLLQHAYAELSHDRLYKPECKVPEKVRRLVARGSALLETTDHMFCEVSRSLDDAMGGLRESHAAAEHVALNHGIELHSRDPQPTFALVDQWSLGRVTKEQLQDLLARRDFLPRVMRERRAQSLIYAHAVGLLGYFAIDRLGRDAAAFWPFERGLLEQMAADLGVGVSD